MATNELTSVDSPSWPDKWWMPFLWIILTPIVTVPLSAILFGVLAGYHEPHEVGLPPNPPPCPRPFELFADPDPDCGPQFGYSEVSVTLLAFIVPGLLNLAPFLWVSSTRPRVRAAGIVAGLLGLLRLALPPTVLMLAQDRVSSDGGSYFEYVLGWFDGSPFIDVWFFGAAAWLGSLLVWWLFILLWGLFIWLWRDTEERVRRRSRLHRRPRQHPCRSPSAASRNSGLAPTLPAKRPRPTPRSRCQAPPPSVCCCSALAGCTWRRCGGARRPIDTRPAQGHNRGGRAEKGDLQIVVSQAYPGP